LQELENRKTNSNLMKLMKQNRWTLALAAAGVVTVPSLLLAADQQPQPTTVLTALSSTSLSGYVDTSAQWNFGTGNVNNPPYPFGGVGKADGFNLNVVDLALDKPLDESQWAAGYHVELWLGPDANTLFTQSGGTPGDFAIRQAYVALRTPIGNGIDWKIGVFDTIIGYESLSSPNNPHYTRSYGFAVEPTTHTGILGTYAVNSEISLSAGVANTFGPTINGRGVSPYNAGTPNESYKTYLGSVALTAPQNWGWLAGSTLSAGVINGFNALSSETANGARQTSFYAGTTLATPMTGLKVGASVDYLDVHDAATLTGEGDGTIWAWALYTSYQATEKLGLNLRGEYVYTAAEALEFNANGSESEVIEGGNHLFAITATAQYDLWKNVLSRVEFRWDHAEHGQAFGGNGIAEDPNAGPNRANAFMLAANVIYKF
jgi:hypothetical protein